jgi:hypothetical protein
MGNPPSQLPKNSLKLVGAALSRLSVKRELTLLEH